MLQEPGGFPVFLYLEDNRTESVCDDCFARLQGEAERELVSLLKSSDPRPGEKWLIQPVDLPQCRGWNVERGDSRRRLHHILDVCAREGLPKAHSTYLDFGCRTGYFCSGMAEAGFNATGVDQRPAEIKAARLLSTYFRRDGATYRLLDAPEYLNSADDRGFDVITAFEISKSRLWQDDARVVQACLRKLFRETGRIFVLEAFDCDRACSDNPAGLPPDRAWPLGIMQSNGGFDRIERIDGRQRHLRHDLLIGYKSPGRPG